MGSSCCRSEVSEDDTAYEIKTRAPSAALEDVLPDALQQNLAQSFEPCSDTGATDGQGLATHVDSSPRHAVEAGEASSHSIGCPSNHANDQMLGRQVEASVTEAMPSSGDSNIWGKVRPLGVRDMDSVSQDSVSWQLQQLAAARALINELEHAYDEFGSSAKADGFEMKLKADENCTIDIFMLFLDNWNFILIERVQGFGCGLLPCLAMARNSELIELPGVLESTRLVKEFAGNDFVHHILGVPFWPIPGADDVHNSVLFDLLEEEENDFLAFIKSPPKEAAEYRGWQVPPLGKGRARTYVDGAVSRFSPSTKTTADLGAPSDTPGKCKSPGCNFFVHTTLGVTGGHHCCKKCAQSANMHDSTCQRRAYEEEFTLVKCGSSDQCVFQMHKELAQGSKVQLACKSQPGKGVGKKHSKAYKKGDLRINDSKVVPSDSFVSVRFENNALLKLADEDLVLCVQDIYERRNVVFVGGSTPAKTATSGRGRDGNNWHHWTINQDGTISLKHCPDLVLGMRLPEVHWDGAVPDHGLSNFTCYVKGQLPVPRWLIATPFLKWVIPKIVGLVNPKFLALNWNFDKTPFKKLVDEDSHGFYEAVNGRIALARRCAMEARPA